MLKGLWQTMRPRQWVKNGFVFVVILFDGKLRPSEWQSILWTVAVFCLFSLTASAVYLMNDLADIESDRQHPKKRSRPLPSGQLSPAVAKVAMVVLAAVGLGGGWLIAPPLGIILTAYFVMQIAYTFRLKHVVLLDVFIIAIGFVLRVIAGTTVIHITRFSPWLYVCTGLLALFLALGKRRHELILLGQNAGSHRAILDEYNLDLIDRLIGMVTTSALVSYSLYTFLAEGLPQNHLMMFTIPFAIYGLSRYLYLIHVKGEGGTPEDILLRDRAFQLNLLLWMGVVGVALYWPI